MAYSGEIWALDLDRTLLDTEATFDLLTEVCAAQDIDKQSLAYAKIETENSGGSFDAISYLASGQAGPINLNQLYRDFVEAGSSESLLYPDATAFLEAIDDRRAKNLILTYGSTDWQETKLRAARQAERPYITTTNKYKGEVIAGWSHSLGYEVRASAGRLIVGASVNLVEDKVPSFRGLPTGCRGILRRIKGEPIKPSQAGEIGQNIEICYSLEDLIPFIK